MRKIRCGAVLGLILTMLMTCAAQAQLLQQVPSDATVLIKINNLKATSDKIAKLAQDLGLAAMVQPLADPLAFLQAQGKIQQGLNLNGEMGIVLLQKQGVGAGGESVLMLIPVTDYKAFLSNWPDAKTENGVSEIKFGTNADDSYVANWGSFAALSPTKEIITEKHTLGLTVPAVSAKELSSKDAVLYANFAAIRTQAIPAVQQGRTMILAQIDNGLKNNPQTGRYVPVLKALVNQVFTVAEGFLNQTQGGTYGIAITPEGINITALAEFSPDTYAANIVTGEKNSDASFLTGLPTAQYLFYGGLMSDPAIRTKVVGDFLDPINKELIALGPDMKPIEDYIDAIKAQMAAVRGQSFGIIAPTGAIGASPLLQFVMVMNGDSKLLMDSYTKMVEIQPEIMKAINIPGADSMKSTHTANAKTVDGVSFDETVTKVDPNNAQNPAAMQQAQMMNMLYGPQGPAVYYGPVSDKQLLLFSGIADPLVSSAIKTAKDNAAPVADNAVLKTVNAQLPKQRIGVMYIALGDIASTGLSYARQFGFAMPLQLPPNLPPIGVTLSTEGTAFRIDAHIPTTLVQSLVSAGLQMRMQQQQNNQGGGI
jgi:hypothetical protein